MNTAFASRFICAALLGTFFPSIHAAQLGHVVSAQKISDTSGGFTAVLDDEDQFGRSIVNLGDMDGDGVTDLMVGAHTDDDGGLDKGSVYVLFMRANGFVKSWQKISDLEGNFSGYLDPGDQFGRAAANLGDLDGDGVTDVAVSSNYDDDGGANKGAIYILFLRREGTVKAVQKISSLHGGLPAPLRIHDEFGRSITSLGDLDGDGITDIVVGTPQDDEGGTNTGALHVLFLNRNGTVKAYKRISRSTDGLRLKPGDWFGHCSANIGDFDHDGVTDIAVGAVLDDDGGVNQGSVWILLLRADGSVKAAQEINELMGGFNVALDDIDQFGTSVASLGDLDGDGVTDIAVGAVKDDDGGMPGNPDADVGAVYVLFLKPDATVKSVVKISDTSGDLPYSLDQYDWFGSALCRLGGSSGDGLFNLAIGCRNDDDGNPNRGSIYLVQLNDGTAPAAAFGVSQTLGVAPLTVAFSDQSTGQVTGWLWNFGDGPQSTLQNPSKTYTVPGVYDVQLTAKGPKGKDTEVKRALVTVSAGPLADFTAAPGQGLAPLSVQFSDRSLGTVTSWSWNFGDGSGSSLRDPQHVFGAGTFSVALTVQGPSGAHTRTYPDLIVVQDLAPQADFAAQPRSGYAPLSVAFSDLSTGALSSWSWDFGDGSGSSARQPTHVYQQPGSYTVTLSAAGAYGADVETRTAYVVVTSAIPVAEFSADTRAGLAPLEVRFQDLSTGNVTSWSWDLGDGATSNAREPVHVYEYAGTYGVLLEVSGPQGTDVEHKSAWIVVAEPPPVAAFQASTRRGFAPFTASFTDQSSGQITSAVWSFGDGSVTSEENPSHTYLTPGTYSVSLTVQGPFGSDVETQTDLILVEDPTPVADFAAPQTSGFAPLAVQFADTSRGWIDSWEWSFGDGTTSLLPEPEHVYAEAGTYTVSLRVAGPAGSDTRTRTNFVVVSPAPVVAAFQAAPTSGFAPLAVQFGDLSTGSVNAWAWDFGDGSGSSAASPLHVYTTPGTYSVRLLVAGPNGSAEELKSGLVQVQWAPPTPDFTAGPGGGFAPLAVSFTDRSSGNITSWQWNFGDGSTSRLRFPVKVYNRTGSFPVTLTVKGPGGTRSVTLPGPTVAAMPVFPDGGFEQQLAGAAPLAPWRVLGGPGALVQSSPALDAGFPREGSKWLEIDGLGSVGATPPSNPRGAGQAPTNTRGVEQSFAFQALAPHLVFDAAFLLGGLASDASAGGFLSVDVSDGVTSQNLYYADGFSALNGLSTRYGLPMTAIERVHVDLRTLFPGLQQGALLRLTVGVGTGPSAPSPSRGYVDSFRFVPAATAAFRNGTGRNAARYVSAPPVLGAAWNLSVDTTGHAGARMIQLVGLQRPASGTQRVAGEVLVSGKKLFAQSWIARAGLNEFSVLLPADLTLMGQSLATQVTITGGATELCNAYDLVLGF